jgi:putative molybdopterin biosynthesis protein
LTRAKTLYVGSLGGVTAAQRGECDLAGVHVLDPKSGLYTRHLVTAELELLLGYRRRQGLLFRPDDPRFRGCSRAEEAVAAALADPDCLLAGRNPGSGTRVLLDRLLQGRHPPGYANQPRSHNAVAAAIAQGRADWGIGIEIVARQYGLGFLPVQDERFDFLVPRGRCKRPGVRRFRALLTDCDSRAALAELGFEA